METIWITIEEGENVTGRSVHTLRKTVKKPDINTKLISGRLMIDKTSLLKHYGLYKEEVNNHDINQNNQVNELINQVSSLIKDNKQMSDDYIKEKTQLGNQLVAIERNKDQEILKINIQKNEEILKKDQEINKKSRNADIYLLLCTVSTIFLALAVFYIYKML